MPDGALTFRLYSNPLSFSTQSWLTLVVADAVDLAGVAVVTGAVDVAVAVGAVARTRRRSGELYYYLCLLQAVLKILRRVPVTKLGRLVKDGKIKSMEEIYLFSLPVKEYQIVDAFLPKLKDEVMKVRTRIFVFLLGWMGYRGILWDCASIVK